MAAGKKLGGWLVVLIVAAVLVLWGVKTNNKMVTAEETVSKAWANVENVYQRRADLIPNLVETVKGVAEYEKSTLEAVVEARAKATQTTLDASELTEENMAAFQAAQDNLSQAFLNPAEVASGAVRTELVLTDTPLVLLLLVLIFGQMYKIGRELAVESELTV